MKICYYIEKQIRGNYIMKQSERCNIDIRQICSLMLLMIITVLTIYLYNTTQFKSLGFDNDSLSVIKDNFHLYTIQKKKMFHFLLTLMKNHTILLFRDIFQRTNFLVDIYLSMPIIRHAIYI